MVANSPQRVCKKCLERMEKLRLFDGRNISFDKALEDLLTFTEIKKRDFEKWKKKNSK